MRVALLVTMAGEAAPIIRELDLDFVSSPKPVLPMTCYRGRHAGWEIGLVTAGTDSRYGVDLAGTQPASLLAELALDWMKPDLLLNAGTAGGFSARGGSIGDLILARGNLCYHDRRIPMDGYREYGEGRYPSLDLAHLAAGIGARPGRISTGNALDFTPEDLRIMEAFQADAKEMEAAAMAWVASLYGVPFTALKAITDIVDGGVETATEFEKNFETAVGALAPATRRLLEALAKTPPPEIL